MHSADLDAITRRLSRDTQALQACFKDWALGRASEQQVSQAFVVLGNDFLGARAQLEREGIPGLVDVPRELRGILEPALAADARIEVFHEFEPQIRAVMARLFHQLKERQRQLAPPRPVPAYPAPSPYKNQANETPSSTGPAGSGPNSGGQFQAQTVRTASAAGTTSAAGPRMPYPRRNLSDRPKPTEPYSSAPGVSGVAHQGSAPGGAQLERSTHRRSSSQPFTPRHHRRTSSDLRFGSPAVGPGNAGFDSAAASAAADPAGAGAHTLSTESALTQLQRNGALERQASKRYSTRQISRIVNSSPADKVPTTDVHRTFANPEFSESSVVRETPATPQQNQRRRISRPGASPLDRGTGASSAQDIQGAPGPVSAGAPPTETPSNESDPTSMGLPAIPDSSLGTPQGTPQGTPHGPAPQSPLPTLVEPRDPTLTVFLRLGKTVRKGSVPRPPSIAALRLQFVEVCAYVPSGEETFPEIMVQDPATSMDYEVTEATIGDVQDGSLLTLNVPGPEEQNVQTELKEIRGLLKELLAKPAAPASSGGAGAGGARGRGPQSPQFSSKFASPVLTGDGKFVLERPGDHKAPGDRAGDKPGDKTGDKVGSPRLGDSREAVLREVGHEVEQVRAASNRTIAACRAEIGKLRTEIRKLASAGVTVVSEESSLADTRGRLDEESSSLVRQMEDIADIIDRQRMDVLSGGYRYTQHELDQVRRMLAGFQTSFHESEQALKSETPVWKSIWQTKLNEVVESQNWVKQLTELRRALQTDLEDSLRTFALVCEANEISKDSAGRQVVLPAAPPMEPGQEHAVANAVFSEIQGLNLNSETRTEAIERAERHIKAKLALRTEEFEAELDTFVADAKLKKNGGYEEVEKRMQEREARARKLGEESEIEGRRQAELARQERRARKAAGQSANADAKPSEEPAKDSEPSTTDNTGDTEAEPKKNDDFVDAPASLPKTEVPEL